MGYFKQKFRNIKKFPIWIYYLPARLLQLYARLFFRIRIVDPNNYIQNAQGMVSVTWHNRLMFFAVLFPKQMRKRTVAVVSASRDGQYIADFISVLGLGSLRGSSSKKGANAYRGGIRAIANHCNVSFTPDGPRGPRYVMKSGPVALASMTGTGVVPVSVNASRCWAVKSWDRFQIPKPFSTLTLILGDALEIPPDLTVDELEKYRQKVEKALLDITFDP
ncbi:MAG: lysophospholipid acyltransferase family protein [Victivallales bacterium]|jgi:lysophospholipid acyltransferase (LPLAT)-like uncharacterized protein|nr:lysophospholipid acyltransferase family protein [Victivallales bacterium]